MPIFEYICPDDHMTEKLFLSFKASEGQDETTCETCGGLAVRIVSRPFPGHFLGNPDGYHKPSPTKRYSTKLATQKGNDSSIG